MSAPGGHPDPERERRRRIVRRATLYTIGFFVAAAVVAVGGAALVALLLRPAGLPFLQAWLVIAALVLLVPAVGLAARTLLRKVTGRRGPEG